MVRIFVLLSIIFVAFGLPTQVYFQIIEQQVQGDDFVELGLDVTVDRKSIAKALQQKQMIIKKIDQLLKSNCPNSQFCSQLQQIQKPYVQPQYKIVKNKNSFQKFHLQAYLQIKIYNTTNYDFIIDSLVSLDPEHTKIGYIHWGAHNSSYFSNVIKKGTQQAREICEHLGKQLKNIDNIQQLRIIENSTVQQTEISQQEKIQENELGQYQTYYRFKITCEDHFVSQKFMNDLL